MKPSVAIVAAAFVCLLAHAAPAAAQDPAAQDLRGAAGAADVARLGGPARRTRHAAGRAKAAERGARSTKTAAVRAVAARVAFVTLSKGAAPALITALAKEEHAHTAAEQVRTLMAFHGAAGDNIIRKAVERIGGPTAIAHGGIAGPQQARGHPAQHQPFLLSRRSPSPIGRNWPPRSRRRACSIPRTARYRGGGSPAAKDDTPWDWSSTPCDSWRGLSPPW